MLIRIKNLRVRTIVGINVWERNRKQQVVINVEMEVDERKAVDTDSLEYSVDYKKTTKRIIQETAESKFHLLESLSHRILSLVMEDARVRKATVEVDKPRALRFAESVSVVCSAERTRKKTKIHQKKP